MADLRLAVVGRNLIGREHVLAVRSGAAGSPIRLVEGVDDDGAVNFDRLLVLALVKHHAAAKTPPRRLVGLVQHGVGPDGYDLIRRSGFVVAEGPEGRLVQVPSAAAGSYGQTESQR